MGNYFVFFSSNILNLINNRKCEWSDKNVTWVYEGTLFEGNPNEKGKISDFHNNLIWE